MKLRFRNSLAFLFGLSTCFYSTVALASDPPVLNGFLDQPASGISFPEDPSPSDKAASGTAVPAPTNADVINNLSEEDIKKIIDKHLKEKADKEEAKLTDKERKDKELQMSAKWNNGLELTTKNKQFRMHLGGRHQIDWAGFSVPQNVQSNINIPYANGVDLRRSRMRMDLTLYEVHEFCAEFDFVNSARVRSQSAPGGLGFPAGTAPTFFDQTVTAPTDLWYQMNVVPFLGNAKMRIGNQKEQVGFEHIVSSRFLPFMERSYNQDTFYGGNFNGFQPGITIFDTYAEEMGVWNVGVFKPTNNLFAASNGTGDWAISGRATRLLLWENDGEQLIHLGVSGRQGTALSQAGVPGRVASYRTRDAIRAGLSAEWPVPASINLFGENSQTANGEFVVVNGPWTWQSEYLINALDDARINFASPGQYARYHGGYMQLLYFITGEHDHYSRKTGAFERVTPRNNFFRNCKCHGASGWGAWQVGFRYNYLDLNDKGLNGGSLNNYTLGLNWFWNPNMKIQFNYSVTQRDMSKVVTPVDRTAGSGQINGFGTRLAIDF